MEAKQAKNRQFKPFLLLSPPRLQINRRLDSLGDTTLSSFTLPSNLSRMDSKECTVLYKILTPSEKDAMPEKAWKGTALDVSILKGNKSIFRAELHLKLKDGFIHTSTSEQVSGTLELFFEKDSGVGDSLYLAAIPRKNVKQDELKFEGEGFPHIYGVSKRVKVLTGSF
jgi:uncharacterized protein (DUF952 family)